MSSSRLPRPRTTSATPKAKATPASASTSTPSRPERKLAAPPTLRTKVSASKLKSSAKSPVTPPAKEIPPPPSQRTLSIKEQIALRRAEQQKKATSTRSAASDNWEEGSVAESSVNGPDEDILGRWSIRDTIDRAKSSGSIVLASRELTQIPTYLFETHLSMTPEPLKNAPPEVVEPEAPSKIKRSGNTTWYEQVDLTSLKVWDNELVEIQPEISLFGSLKIIDVRISLVLTELL
ncbi:1195_t:CDS:2 [Acaulospora colombiana]|uniref:1195_t:CDS:1 n=1 Tax=Acaulospora colombiana TaxID=27376 RepID=A0ACA9PDZ2_9GLOM|nr:1195_t:CDS:2 [Acaulospora colombiana]